MGVAYHAVGAKIYCPIKSGKAPLQPGANTIMPRTHEHNLNTALGILLRQQGLRAGAERPLKGQGGGRADCRIRFGAYTIIVEAKVGQTGRQQQDAIADCLRRIDHAHCHAAIAVCYPEDADEDTLAHARLCYAIVDQDNRSPQWAAGTPADLASAVALAPAQLGNADLAAARLSDEIGKAIELLSYQHKESLAQRLDLPATPEPRRKNHRSAADYSRALTRWQTTKYDTAAVRAALVIASAVMFHARLDAHLSAADRPDLDARAPERRALRRRVAAAARRRMPPRRQHHQRPGRSLERHPGPGLQARVPDRHRRHPGAAAGRGLAAGRGHHRQRSAEPHRQPGRRAPRCHGPHLSPRAGHGAL